MFNNEDFDFELPGTDFPSLSPRDLSKEVGNVFPPALIFSPIKDSAAEEKNTTIFGARRRNLVPSSSSPHQVLTQNPLRVNSPTPIPITSSDPPQTVRETEFLPAVTNCCVSIEKLQGLLAAARERERAIMQKELQLAEEEREEGERHTAALAAAQRELVSAQAARDEARTELQKIRLKAAAAAQRREQEAHRAAEESARAEIAPQLSAARQEVERLRAERARLQNIFSQKSKGVSVDAILASAVARASSALEKEALAAFSQGERGWEGRLRTIVREALSKTFVPAAQVEGEKELVAFQSAFDGAVASLREAEKLFLQRAETLEDELTDGLRAVALEDAEHLREALQTHRRGVAAKAVESWMALLRDLSADTLSAHADACSRLNSDWMEAMQCIRLERQASAEEAKFILLERQQVMHERHINALKLLVTEKEKLNTSYKNISETVEKHIESALEDLLEPLRALSAALEKGEEYKAAVDSYFYSAEAIHADDITVRDEALSNATCAREHLVARESCIQDSLRQLLTTAKAVGESLNATAAAARSRSADVASAFDMIKSEVARAASHCRQELQVGVTEASRALMLLEKAAQGYVDDTSSQCSTLASELRQLQEAVVTQVGEESRSSAASAVVREQLRSRASDLGKLLTSLAVERDIISEQILNAEQQRREVEIEDGLLTKDGSCSDSQNLILRHRAELAKRQRDLDTVKSGNELLKQRLAAFINNADSQISQLSSISPSEDHPHDCSLSDTIIGELISALDGVKVKNRELSELGSIGSCPP